LSFKRKSLGLPFDWDTPDMKGFIEYAKTYYRKIWSIASELARTVPSPEGKRDFRFLLFQVMATPLVYLYEQWTTRRNSCLLKMLKKLKKWEKRQLSNFKVRNKGW